MVGDLQFYVVAVLPRAHQDGLAGRAMLARVAHQVGHDLGDAVGVRHQRQSGLHVRLDAQAGVGLALFLDQAIDQVAEVAQAFFDAQPHAAL